MKENEIFGDGNLIDDTAKSIASGGWSETSIYNRLSYIYQLGEKHGIDKCKEAVVNAYKAFRNSRSHE